MIIRCKSCSRKFIVKDADIPKDGRSVQCGYCSSTWYQMPQNSTLTNDKKIKLTPTQVSKVENNVNIKELKASDGKKYKYLGNQWAVLLPSGKTGLFAKKKISIELDEVAGIEREQKNKIDKVNPSSADLSDISQLPNVYKPKEGLGFFGYIFIFLIIVFSLIGGLKTFEASLLNIFPQVEFVYELLDKQLNYFSETVKNMIIIFNDLLNSY